MTNRIFPIPSSWQPISRDMYLSLIQAGLAVEQYGFAREAVLAWLAYYPGDLRANLLYAKAVLGEGRIKQAIQIFDGLGVIDPEFVEAIETRLEAGAYLQNGINQESKSEINTSVNEMFNPGCLTEIHLYVLTGQKPISLDVPSWGEDLRQARLALYQKDLSKVEESIRNVLIINPPTPLACVTHLKYLELSPVVSEQIRRKIAMEYHQRWPNTLACKLLFAHWLMEGGKADQAVALLHESVSRDVAGQVVTRLWGDNNPYRFIWPDKLELNFEYSIPYEVISFLGWNQLRSGDSHENGFNGCMTTVGSVSGTSDVSEDGLDEGIILTGIEIKNHSDAKEEEFIPSSEPIQELIVVKEQSEVIHAVNAELVRLGAKRNLPDVINWDGRFPVYVVLSVRKNLGLKFGQEAADKIVSEMQNLVRSVQGKHHWNAKLFLVDDPTTTEPVGIKAISTFDPWKLKLMLKDLDAALEKRGEMIGALLIVGGADIVPFHLLPNPLDDQDTDVPSDSPYATRDTNYFIPEWSVGRIPDGGHGDPTFLLESLQRICAYHKSINQRPRWYQSCGNKLMSWIQGLLPDNKRSIGYTAAVWRQASINVFKPIGEEKCLYSSPPMGLNGSYLDDATQSNKKNDHRSKNIPSTIGRLGYFNLHGLPDALEWYGQRDPDALGDGPDYPIALRPQDIGKNGKVDGNHVPQVVFSEACYGLHILEKDFDEAIAMKFLKSGSKGIVGSTCMSYGSINPPLIGADLLGFAFWKFLRDGLSTGEALKKAKVHLAREMNQRQGYLDGEDQKTLISFILLGDPLARPFNTLIGRKNPSRRLITKNVNIVCDRNTDASELQSIPDDILERVKQIVAQYLPGMKDAQIHFSHERGICEGKGHHCPTSQLNPKSNLNQNARRQLITLSKMVNAVDHTHTVYARLTLNNTGKLEKLVISR